MIIVLPSQPGRKAFNEMAAELRLLDLVVLLDSMSITEVTVQIPRFAISRTLDLKKTLPKLGVQEVFQGKANLSGIANEPLFVSSAIHKAKVKVNEKGTTAAAATGVVVQTLSAAGSPRRFIANHPFIFFIVDNASGTVLFMGNVLQFPAAP